MVIQRVAVIFDDTARPETTGGYCRRALGGLVEVQHFLPTELAQIPRESFDLYLFIDDGLRYPIPTGLGLSAYWAIDTHLDLEWGCERGRHVDLLFAAQQDGAEKLRAAGFAEATWLPLACDPEVHRKHEIPKKYDLAFVGNLVVGPRVELVRLLSEQFPNSFVGQRYFDEMARIYSESRIVFNRSILNDVNMRVFEGLACGSLLLTNDLHANGQADLFREGVHLATYRDPEEFLDKARYYLQHEAFREQIAAAGRAEVLAQHTYAHRMRTILDIAERFMSRTSVAIPTGVTDHAPARKKDWSYFEFARPEVVALVPETARRVLDIGCSAGRLGASIKGRQSAHVTGVELNPEAAAIARQRLDRVVEGSVESAEIDFPEESFECVVCADVLEHLRDPQRVLKKIRRWLTPDGCLVTSVPNVRHHSVVRGLLEGDWTYESAGLLDDTHLQFWTWRDLRRLLERVGFSVSEQQFVPGAEFEEWRREGKPDRIVEGILRLEGLPPGEGEQFHAYQYLIRATPIRRPTYSLTSIVIVTHNQWAYTEQCLASLQATTDEPYELIVVDNGSTDGTVEHLQRRPGVTLIANPDNNGFPAAVNQGIKAAQGEQILLLNNDVLLTSGWLRRMLDALRSGPEIGLVGPCTNCTAGTQRIHASYPLRELEDFAWKWSETRRGRRRNVPELTGFCLLFRREVVARVGLLDERFGIGVYEDVDYALRAVQAGFQLVIAEDVFVHHFGHRSFQGAGLDQEVIAARNRQLFQEKWAGVASPLLESETKPPVTTAPTTSTAPPQITTRFAPIDTAGLLALLPPSAEKILVLGDTTGLWAEAVKRQTGRCVSVLADAELVGAPLSPAVDASENLPPDHWSAVPFAEPYDCVIWAHLAESADPGKALAQIRRWLVPGGTLLASVPNVGHEEIVTALIRGTWAPVRPGSTERPLRFFTRREIEKLLFRHRLTVQTVKAYRDGSAPALGVQSPNERSPLGSFGTMGMPPDSMDEATAERYLIRADALPAPIDGLTSIILVTFNELRYTRACLDSLRLRTDEPYELVIVDNGSTDGTVDYLRSLDDVTLIANLQNRGFPAAANQGLRAARGKNLLLLNNDTVVTTGWLRRMLDVFARDPAVGLVGPCSNRCSGPQEVAVTYDRVGALDGFAWEWGKAHDQETVPIDRLVGFCLLFRRDVVDRIGLLDERFGIGNFEDDDFCRRGIAAGFQAVIAADAFVHHYGSRTFLGSGVDFAGLLEENRRKYEAKWNGTSKPVDGAPQPRIGNPQGTIRKTTPWFTLKPSPAGGLLLVPNTIRLSLCMIVRDNETTIGPCLESIKPYVDEIIVVDTGSTDRTPAICREHGAQVFEFPWCDDFSAARNESLKHARGEWLFWMDSDDTITAECGRKLRGLADGSHPDNVLGYVMQVHCPGPAEDGPADVTVVDHVKLIRNRPDLRFEGRIHEQLLPAIRRVAGDVAWTDLYVVHSGSDHSDEGWERKLERDLRILHRELEEQPQHPFVLFNLGMTYADAEDYDRAVDFLKRCLAISKPEESHLRKAYALLVSSLSQADRHDEAWEICRKGLHLYPGDKELLFRSAMLSQHFGKLNDAERDYLRVINETEERHFTSVDQGMAGYKARHNLALVYEEMGRLDQTETQWRLVVRDQPQYREGWRGLASALMKQQKFDEAATLAERLAASEHESLRCEGALLEADLFQSRGEFASARTVLTAALARHPHDQGLLETHCRLLFERGAPEETEHALQALLASHPDNPSAWHNLGTIRMRQGRHVLAIDAYQNSLDRRPDSVTTLLSLGYALDGSGRKSEAATAWHRVLQLEPKNHEAAAALQTVG